MPSISKITLPWPVGAPKVGEVIWVRLSVLLSPLSLPASFQQGWPLACLACRLHDLCLCLAGAGRAARPEKGAPPHPHPPGDPYPLRTPPGGGGCETPCLPQNKKMVPKTKFNNIKKSKQFQGPAGRERPRPLCYCFYFFCCPRKCETK